MEDKQWIEKKYCCGCGLCNNFTNGTIDKRGFYRPLDKKEFFEKFDSSVCYYNAVSKSVTDNIWGKIQGLYYGYSNNNELRHNASSGGVLSEIASFLLKKKVVDCIIQIKVSKDSHIMTELSYSFSENEVKSCCGSRYTASASLSSFLSSFDSDKKYAIVAKPCDIRVIREFINKNKEYKKNIEFLLSFFCAGTPSKQANENLLNIMGTQENKLEKFTYRGNGWPGKTLCIEKDGNTYSMEYEESWGQYLGRDIQEICRFCWEGTGEAADICCGDGWHVENGKPIFKEGKGRNIIFARTEKGDALLKSMSKENIITLEKSSNLDILKEMQPGQYMRKTAMFSRVLAMKICFKKVPNYSLKKLYIYSKLITPKENFIFFAGTIKRILKGKI